MKELLFKPFEKYSEYKLIVTGILITSIGLFLGNLYKARFDGAIDVHFSSKVSMSESILDFIYVAVSLVLFLYIAARIVNVKTRFIDIVSTAILSRSIIYFLSFFNMNGWMGKINNKLLDQVANKENGILQLNSNEILLLVFAGLVSILMTIWYISLLYNGYKTASNAKGSKAIVLFIVALLLAEISSKLLINYFIF